MTDEKRILDLEQQLAEFEKDSQVDIYSKIDVLNELAWLLSDIDSKRAYSLSEKAYTLSETGDDDSLKKQLRIAYGLRTQGYLNQRVGDFPQGMIQLLRAQEIFEAQNIDGGLADVLDGIAGIYYQIGDLPEALAYIYKQLGVSQRTGDASRIANANNNLSVFYTATGDYGRAVETLSRNLKIVLENGNKRIECLSHLNLAETYLLAGEQSKALESASRALAVCRQAGYAIFEVHALQFLGMSYHKAGDLDQAILYLEHALDFSRSLEFDVGELMVLFELAKVYRDMGQIDLALENLHMCTAAAESADKKYESFSAHLVLSEIYEQQGDFVKALSHFKQFQTIKELVYGEKADQRLKVLQVAHDTETARKEATFFQLKNQQLEQEIAERTRVEAQLQRQLALIRAVSEFSKTLLARIESETDYQPLLTKSLRPLVSPTDASAAFIYKNILDPDLGPCSYLMIEVCAPGIAPLFTQTGVLLRYQELFAPFKDDAPVAKEHPRTIVIPWSITPPEFTSRLSAGEPLGGPVRELYAAAPAWRDYLLGEHILSIQFFPIHVSGQFWGIIGLDDRVHEHVWTEDEVLLLGTAAEVLESTLRRWQAEEQLRAANDQLEQDVRSRTIELSNTIVALHEEIAERERAEAEIQNLVQTLEQRVAARTEELVTFFDLILLAGEAATPIDVIELALPRILEVTRSQAICIHRYNVDHANLWLAAQQNLTDEACARLQTVELPVDFRDWMQQPNDPLVAGTLSQPTILPSVFHTPEFQTYLGVQIRIGKRIEGILSCYRDADRGYGLDDMALIIALAEQIGMMLENHRLRQNAEEMAVLEERQRLARDLHDSVTQSLYSLTLFSRAGREAAEDGDHDRLIHSLTELERNTLHALLEMRLLLYELRPADLEEGGLISAVKLRLNTVERRVGLQVDVLVDEYKGMSPAREIQLYYIIVEALNNVVKHAAATHLTLQLTQTNGNLHLRIVDNGQGFDPEKPAGGMGLRNIRERAARLDGQLSITSGLGNGTQLEIRIPCQREENQ